MQKTTEPALKREIGILGLALNAINLTIGAGIFVLPAVVAQNLGRSAFIAYLLCGLLVILIMLCYAEIGSRVTGSGGSYAYVEKAFGPLAGFLINTLFWFGFAALSNAAVVNALADMLAIWYQGFTSFYIRIPFFIALYGLLTYINIRGVKQGSQFAGAMCLLKLTPLILLIVVGVFSISAGNLTVKTIPAIKTIGATALTLFFAFGGIETALNVSGEIKNPRSTIPKGIFTGVFGVLVIYMLLQLVSQGVLGDSLAGYKEAPLASLAIRLIGPVGGTIILITAVVSMLGMIGGDVLASSRLLFAASTDKLLPDVLGRIHPKFATPYMAVAAYSVIIVILASGGGFKQLATLASSSVLIIYLAVVLAMIKLRFKKEDAAAAGFKIPGGMLIPILAVISICWFLYQVTWPEVKAMWIFFLLCTAFYFINQSVRKIK
ncbi:MAG: amino acid permease [Ferruginibacter sp.]|nr:amino acid permease [Ferruginibacter sp.]